MTEYTDYIDLQVVVPYLHRKNLGWIDEYPKNSNFLVYDIESTLVPSGDIISEKQVIKDNHKLLSIAANSYVNGTHTEKVWVISESTEKARMDIVKEFLMFCNDEASRMEVDSVSFTL